MNPFVDAAGNVVISKVLDWAFAYTGTALERQQAVEAARSLEASGMKPEQVLVTLANQRQTGHQELVDKLK